MGQGTTAAATGLDQNGAAIATGTVAWSSSAPAIATVDAAGVVTAVAVGQAQILATVGGKQGQALLTVQPVPVATVAIAPTSTVIEIGETRQFAATTYGPTGATLGGRAVSWTSSDSSRVRVSASGLASAVGTGAATITATSEGKSGTIAVTATTIRVASLTITAPATPIAPGQVVALRAVARDDAGTVLSGRAITWRSDRSIIATVSDTGLLTAVGGGIATITATSFSRSGSATVTVMRTNATQWVEVARLQGSASLSNGTSAIMRQADGSSLAIYSGPTWNAVRGEFSCTPVEHAAVRISSGAHLTTVPMVSPAGILHPNVSAIGDFDGDGQQDVFFGNTGCDRSPYNGEPNSVLMSRAGVLTTASGILPPINAFTHSMDAADVRGVGVSDVMVTNNGNFGCNATLPGYVTNPRNSFSSGCALTVGPYLLRGNRDGTFTYDATSLPDSVAKAPTWPSPNENWLFNSTLLDDVTGDGKPDLVLGTFGSAPSAGVMYPNDGSGGFRTTPVRMPAPLFGALVTSVVRMRLWASGGRRVLLLSSVSDSYRRNGLQFLEYAGGAFRDVTTELLPGFNTSSFWVQNINVVDLDLDGCPDLVLDAANPGPGDVNVWYCRNGRFVPAPQPAVKRGLVPVWVDGLPMLLSIEAPLGGSAPIGTTIRLYDLR